MAIEEERRDKRIKNEGIGRMEEVFSHGRTNGDNPKKYSGRE